MGSAALATSLSLQGDDEGYEPLNTVITALPNGQQLLTGLFKDTGRKSRRNRPFRIVIHDGFYRGELGVYLWKELNLQVRYALRHNTGEINIIVPMTISTNG
jgi:hypothetical protein